MRLAVLAASSYAACGQLPELSSAEVDLDILGQRLAEPDAGFVVHAFKAERGLVERVESLLESAPAPVEELLFYFAGYLVSSDERGPALLLDGERLGTFAIKRLRRLLAEKARHAFVVLDTTIALESASDPRAAVAALGAALSGSEVRAHRLLASRPDAGGTGRSACTRLIELVLDWHSVKSTALGADALFEAMRAEPSLFAEVPAVEYFAGPEPFEVLKAKGAALPSLPPAPLTPAFAPATRPSPEDRTRALAAGGAAAASGNLGRALDEVISVVRTDPRAPEPYRLLIDLFQRAGRPDGAWNAACALEALGAADVNESLLASTHRPQGLLPAAGVLSERDWQQKLFCLERDSAVDQLLSSLGDAAVAVGLETAGRKKRVPKLDPATEHDLEKSTTTLCRTLLWSSRLLGFPKPRLHVLETVPGDMMIAPLGQPTLLAGKALGSGLTLPELAFLWARCLVLLRPEHRLLTLLTDPNELESFGRAAMSLGNPEAAGGRALGSDAKLFLRALKRHLRAPELEKLGVATRVLSAEALAAHLASWSLAVQRAAGRAGLLACGNLELALRMVERFPAADGSSSAQQGDDLLVFSLSAEYAALRERLGVALQADG
jgi:hypothetical protein